MFQNFLSKIKEALLAVTPVTVIVFFIHFSITPLPANILYRMIIGCISLVIGMSVFALGADIALMPMGENIGQRLSISKKWWLILILCFFIGIMITLAEPDLHVLAQQFKNIPKTTLIIAVAFGVGFYFAIALLRVVLKIQTKYILALSYGLVLLLSAFVPNDFIGIAFDAGGVTTGAITVPFLLSIGIGIAMMKSGGHSQDNSFGLLGICSVGPIITVMIIGIINGNVTQPLYTPIDFDSINGIVNILGLYFKYILDFMASVAMSLTPIIVFYIVFSRFLLNTTKLINFKVFTGIFFTFIGVVIFLAGVNLGFISLGNYLGQMLAQPGYEWALVAFGIVTGLSIVVAEPSVQVLVKQVESITNGLIKKKSMLIFLSLGVAISISFCMLRILINFPILYFLIPGYAICITLSFIVPQIFTAIAFDSGGIASGTITVVFILPLAMGASFSLGGNIVQDAFGVSGMVAMTPIITIQVLGLIYKLKEKKLLKNISCP